jgi:putative SOS response-associated peptidase YedK
MGLEGGPVCGRVALFTPPGRLARLLEATLAAGLEPEGRPSWNVGPQRTLFALTEPDGRVLDRYRWGLLPSWAKDPAISSRLFNARAETVAEKPSFRSAFARRPCVVPVDGFYEWDHREGRRRQPHYFTRTDGALLLFAGLHESWHDAALGEDAPRVRTCTIITTTPSDDLEGIHDRMPVVLEPDELDLWLDPSDEVRELRRAVLDPAPAGTLVHHGVSPAVGNVRNDGPELIASVETGSLF